MNGIRGYRADSAFDGERVLPDGALVLIEGHAIVGVEPATAPAPVDCEVSYLPGTTLLPGLIDAHVHLCGDGGPDALDQIPDLDIDALDRVIAAAMQAQLVAGVTTVRDLGDHQWAVLDRYRGRGNGPTVVAAGPPITSVGGHCGSMGGQAQGIEELRRAVQDRADHGADVVKIMTSGGAMTPGTDILACQFTLEELLSVVTEAHQLGLPVTAHAHGLPAVQQCVAGGVDGIEHCSCLTPTGFRTPPELVEALAAAGTLVCPTLGRAMLGEPPPQIKAVMERTGTNWEGRLAQVADLHRGGVTLVSGADSGISPGKPHGVLPVAVADLVDCGLSPSAALASATSVAARACELSQRTGRLQPGLTADLLIVDGDPSRDVTALRNVRTVVARGQEVHRSD